MNKHIGILGCGWLGFPLAKSLIKKGYHVKGTTTSTDKLMELQKEGIEPFEIRLTETGTEGNIKEFLSQVGTLIINVPPKLRGNNAESFVDKIKFLISELKDSEISNIIFVSSTAVYGDLEGEVTEATPVYPNTESGRQLVQCENMFQKEVGLDTTIVRFGGLIGPDRHPVTTLSGRKQLGNGNHAINLIHLYDCIHMIQTILEEGYWGEIFNGVYPYHPKKQLYYFEEAQKRGIPTPSYKETSSKAMGKIVLSQNFLNKSHNFTTSIVS